MYGKLITNINGHTATCRFAINIDDKIIPKAYPIFLGFSINFSIKYITQTYIIKVASGELVNNEKNDFIVLLDNIPTNCSVKVTCSSEGVLINSMERLINDDIRGILEDLEIETLLKEKIDAILFSELPIRKKRIAIRKLKRAGLEPKFIKMFLNLLEYIKTV